MDETIENLAKAFVGESQARNRYTMYAKVARKEGYEQIAEIFLLTADNERVHARILFEFINALQEKAEKWSEIKIEAGVPTVLGNTIDNLKAAIAGENHEYNHMYPEFAKIAEDEGLHDIAQRLKAIAVAEQHHEERYLKILEQLEKGTFFKKGEGTWWVCRECGYAYFGSEPPEKCPACEHPQAFYQLKCETY